MNKIVAGGLAAALLAGALGTFTAMARADDATAPAGDPGAARISLVSGNVAVERSDTHANVAAAVNAPVLTGDALTTGAAARTEIQFDGRSILRAGENTQVRFANLDPDQTVVQLAQGTVSVDLLDGSSIRPEVDTPSISVRPDTVGRFRITVTSDGQTLVTVRAGTADVITPQGNRTIGIGATLVAQGAAANPTITTQASIAMDDFDRFNINRDAELDSALAADNSYGSYDAQDLGAYGQWVDDPTYGEVWVPDNQTSAWAPYRDGEWVWGGAYYGYTWVSYEPWGWAPYHYGRWAYMPHRGWGWCPPGRRAIWAPGLVAFFGFGGGVSLGLSFGNVGWVALGPGDPFHPWWGSGRREGFVNDVAFIDHDRNYRDGGASSIGAERWKQGDFRHNQPVDPSRIGSVVGFDGRVPMAPSAQNMRFSRAALPASLADRRFDSATFGSTTYAHGGRATVGMRSGGNNPWGRFSQSRGNPSVNGGVRSDVSTRRAYDAPTARAQAASSDPWARFTQERANVDSGRQYQARSYWQPSRSYSQPSRSYWQPSRSYSQPSRSYSQPSRSYSQPSRSYSQPSRSYSQPSRSYSQPSRSYSRPQQSSHSSSHSGGGSTHHH